jgi:glycerol-3-phosphate acyltransferase PlsY
MNWDYVIATSIFGVFGYLIGSISSAIIYSKIFKKEDIRKKGSGNAGATNVLRVYGKKIGAIVFSFDMLKLVVVVLISWIIKKFSGNNTLKHINLQIISFMVVVGHIWPIYFKFKGGKGAACFATYFLVMQWILFLIGLISILIIIWKTKKVSIGSIFTPIIVIIFQLIFLWIPGMHSSWDSPLIYDEFNGPIWLTILIALIIYILVFIKHIPNLKRIIKGNENKLKN